MRTRPGKKKVPGAGKSRNKNAVWSNMRMNFIMCWKGNDVEAAREAGYKTPLKDASRLMKIPEIAAAIEKKREQMVEFSAKKIATKATKVDVIERALKLADLSPKETNNTIHGQVAALKLVGEMQGFMVKGMEHDQFRKQLEGKTDEEKEFFSTHGYWPPSQSGGTGSVN